MLENYLFLLKDYPFFSGMTEEELLEKLERARESASEGKYRSADSVISDIRRTYGL